MTEVIMKSSATPVKDQRSNVSNSLPSQKDKDGSQSGDRNKSKNIDASHNKQQQLQQQNSATKKRKMNHTGGPPNAANNNQNGGSGGGSGSGNWIPGGPGGPRDREPPFAHRLTGAPAWDLPPQNTSTQTFTGMF